MSHPHVDELSQIPLFAGLSDDQLTELASKFDVETFEPGHPAIREGQHGYVFFVLAEGSARVELDGHVVERLGPGSVFGEMAFFAQNSLRAATVIPESSIRVFSLFGISFRTMQLDYPEVAARLQQLFTERMARDQSLIGEQL